MYNLFWTCMFNGSEPCENTDPVHKLPLISSSLMKNKYCLVAIIVGLWKYYF